jgi:hypothetical protein
VALYVLEPSGDAAPNPSKVAPENYTIAYWGDVFESEQDC